MSAESAVPVDAVRGCPLGCGRPGHALGELPKTSTAPLSRTHYTLTRCGCGALLYLSPAPSTADLTTMYVDQGQFGSEYTDEARVRAILGYMGEALRALERHAGGAPHRPLRVLEVGAGLSWMCRAAKARNAASVTVAQDVSPEAVDACPWVDHYVLGDVADPRLDALAPFDIVSMTHVIEHLVNPVGVVARCRKLMAPHALLFVTAPHRPRAWNEAAPDLDVWTAYSYNHVPAHVQYFSEASLSRLAEAAGCRLVYWSHAHEGGEAFEAWLAPQTAAAPLGWWHRAAMAAGRKWRRAGRALLRR